MNKSNGYGSSFNRNTKQDKEIVKLEVARAWRASMSGEFGTVLGEIRMNDDDPPDFRINHLERVLDCELVQLLNESHRHRAAKGETPYTGQLFLDTQWTSQRFAKELNGVIEKKNDRYRRQGVNIDVLVIYTEETWLGSEQAAEFLETIEVTRSPQIRNAFLLFDHDPGRKVRHWPIFKLFGDLV